MQGSYNRRDFSADAHQTGRLSRIRCSFMAISKVWEWPLTVYNIVKLERWGQMLRIIGNSWKKTAETIAMMSVKYIHRSRENTASSSHLEA